jgi:hypothetical protein
MCAVLLRHPGSAYLLDQAKMLFDYASDGSWRRWEDLRWTSTTARLGARWISKTLKAEIEHGRSVEEVAEFLCRAGTINEVARKCEELGLKPKARSDNIDIDHKTSRSICDEVGERLQQDSSLEASPLPPYLARLIDELRKQDEMNA